MMKQKRNKLVYDFPLRVFHWLLVIFFAGAFFIAKVMDSESPIYQWHMVAGLVLLVIVGFRLIWGVVGAPYSQFKSFELAPLKLIGYMLEVLVKTGKRYVGHNPASSYAALGMFACIIGLGTTGILMTSNQFFIEKSDVEDIHELFANGFVLIVIAHLMGLAIHVLKHRDSLPLSMLDGKKMTDEQTLVVKNNYLMGALLVFIAGFSFYYFAVQKPNIQFFGISLNLSTEEAEANDQEKNVDQQAQTGDEEENNEDD